METLQATWDKGDDKDHVENESQEEVINICFMAIENEIHSNENSLYDEHLEEFENFVLNSYSKEKLFIEKGGDEFFENTKGFEKVKVDHNSLIKENSSLKENILDLTKIVHKFLKAIKVLT